MYGRPAIIFDGAPVSGGTSAFAPGAVPGQIGMVTSPAGGVHPGEGVEGLAGACAQVPAALNAAAATSSFLLMFGTSRIECVSERKCSCSNPRSDRCSAACACQTHAAISNACARYLCTAPEAWSAAPQSRAAAPTGCRARADRRPDCKVDLVRHPEPDPPSRAA